jgi:hypothetical protein
MQFEWPHKHYAHTVTCYVYKKKIIILLLCQHGFSKSFLLLNKENSRHHGDMDHFQRCPLYLLHTRPNKVPFFLTCISWLLMSFRPGRVCNSYADHPQAIMQFGIADLLPPPHEKITPLSAHFGAWKRWAKASHVAYECERTWVVQQRVGVVKRTHRWN